LRLDAQPLLEATVLDWVELEPGNFAFIFIPPTGHADEFAPASGKSCDRGGCGGCGKNGQH